MAELTCPKCGMKYCGVGCPHCDYPPVPAAPAASQHTLLWGCVSVAFGLFLAAQYFFKLYYHNELLVIGGSMLALAGFQIAATNRLYKQDSRPSAFVVGLLSGCAAYLCLYGAFSNVPVSGPLPFLPPLWNQKLGKFIFGTVGCIIACGSLWLFYRTIIPPKPKK